LVPTSRLRLLRFFKTLFFGVCDEIERLLEESALNDKRLVSDPGLEIGNDSLLRCERCIDDASSMIDCEGDGNGCCGC
jgi:hypothetical protein